MPFVSVYQWDLLRDKIWKEGFFLSAAYQRLDMLYDFTSVADSGLRYSWAAFICSWQSEKNQRSATSVFTNYQAIFALFSFGL